MRAETNIVELSSDRRVEPAELNRDRTQETPALLSYSYICGAGVNDTRLVEVPEDRLQALIRPFLSFVQVDEIWYRKTNPDVDQAITSGQLASAHAHYMIAGFFEDRWPYPITVDQAWYQLEYPDVGTAIKRGSVESCQDHFNRYGFFEGRLPCAGWSLLSGPPMGSKPGSK